MAATYRTGLAAGLSLWMLLSAPVSAKEADSARFRFGVSGGPGGIFGSSTELGLWMTDLRFGVQLHDALAFYVQPQFGLYVGSAGSASGFGGVLGATALADVMLDDVLFLAAGAGYAVLTTQSGPELHLRLGGYPVIGRDIGRRRALLVGADLRVHLLDAGTFVSPTLSIGYEAF